MAGEGEVFFHDMTWHEVTNETEKQDAIKYRMQLANTKMV